jgi:hypothetical protein
MCIALTNFDPIPGWSSRSSNLLCNLSWRRSCIMHNAQCLMQCNVLKCIDITSVAVELICSMSFAYCAYIISTWTGRILNKQIP